MNDDQHIASESELGARLITTTPDLERCGSAHSQAGSSAKPSNPENTSKNHRTQLSSVVSELSCNTPAEQGVLEHQLNHGQWSFDCA